jgi:tripartite-type tricarboxylate transporter receptor subunit TctC
MRNLFRPLPLRLARRTAIALATLAAALPVTAAAQGAWPQRQLSLIVPFTAGSQPDILARAFADGLGRLTGQPVVVLNREGASGTIAVEAVANARPDGYTLGFGPSGQFTIQPHLRRDLGYKVEGFEFLCQTNSTSFVIATGPGTPYRSLAQLLDAARAAPGKLNFGSAGHTTAPHLVMESIAAEAGVKVTHVPFKNIGDMYVQVVNGTVDFISSTPVALTTGRGIRGLAVVGDARLADHPDIPTVRELGFKRSTFPGLRVLGLYAPRGIPPQAIETLRATCPKVLEQPASKSAGEKTGTPVTYLDGPAYGAGLREDSGAVGELLGTLGIKPQ